MYGRAVVHWATVLLNHCLSVLCPRVSGRLAGVRARANQFNAYKAKSHFFENKNKITSWETSYFKN